MTDDEIWIVIKQMYTDPTISLILIQKMFDIARKVSDMTEGRMLAREWQMAEEIADLRDQLLLTMGDE
jgi:hypothetical protein